MDNIDRIMKEADRLGFGCSYGKYRAAYPNGSADVLPSAKRASSGKKIVVCRHCGKAFVVRHGKHVYCSEECREAVFYQRQRDYYAKKSKVPLLQCVLSVVQSLSRRLQEADTAAKNAQRKATD